MPAHGAEIARGLLEKDRGVRLHERTGHRAAQAAQHPAQDDRIADGNAQRAQQRNPADHGAHGLFAAACKAVLIRADGARAGKPAGAELRGQAHPSEQEHKQQIWNEERRAAILADAIGKHPDVAQAHGGADTGDDKAHGRAERAVAVVVHGDVLSGDNSVLKSKQLRNRGRRLQFPSGPVTIKKAIPK